MRIRENKLIRPILAGIVAMACLLMTYWLILYLVTGDINHPWQQFLLFKYWMLALIIGFGIQFAMYWYIKLGLPLSGKSTKAAVVTGATTSVVSMAACCAHHIFDIIPLLGFSVVALFLSKYQTYFFALGIISNITGIYIMFHIIKYQKLPDILNKFNLKRWRIKRKLR